MVIARPVEASNGQVLCAKGTTLSESLLARLERLDITHITVEGRPIDDGRPQKTIEGELAELDQRFKGVMSNKMMAALKGVVQKHLKKRHERLAAEEAAEADRQAQGEAGG